MSDLDFNQSFQLLQKTLIGKTIAVDNIIVGKVMMVFGGPAEIFFAVLNDGKIEYVPINLLTVIKIIDPVLDQPIDIPPPEPV